ncbi:hypothetical protein LTR36_004298 [Oleoguttula mirabilis]|uniref:HTH La-type RNA-binding domain-containing protein n=1 Tax=Oleoguttula mirabilis TaxID=1507867 RepID=A0AAV9JGT2_9PEZI|nr:hypothetical protein LTR36_004298 [Oleoguttula mirabilis]
MAPATAHSHGGETAMATSVPDTMPAAASLEPHPQADEILRQIEFYFSDDNLHQDSHLLALTGGDGTGPVSLGHILSFSKMRKFKERAKVRETLKQSQLVKVIDSKRIQRRFPLTRAITVRPVLSDMRLRKFVPEDKPWMTKNMMKATGFEPNATVGPITPKEHAEGLEKYDPDSSFISRIEEAVQSFNNKRTMHQDTRSIFSKFMIFGGIDGGANMFQGGMTRDQLKKDGHTKEEIDQTLAYYAVSERVKDAYYAYEDGVQKVNTWVIDFECLAKAFLSDPFMSNANWYEEDRVKTATQVLRNFYNYLLYHDVCPEYADQLHAAREVCDLAEAELAKLAVVDQCLPGAFNAACSTLYQGSYAGLKRTAASAAADDDDAGWIHVGENIGLSEGEAIIIFKAGIAAYGTDEQYAKVATASVDGRPGLKVVSQEKLGLEVVAIVLPEGEVKEMYDAQKRSYGYVDPMGKLICKRWNVPYAPPSDLPARLTNVAANEQTLEFLVEAEVLAHCYLGIKMEVIVKELDIGVKWIDSVDAVFPSFYTYLPNERIRKWTEPGEQKAWMGRQEENKKNGGGEMNVTGEGGQDEVGEGQDGVGQGEHDTVGGYSDEEPD